ncbi:MAG TPA: hypothetical protein VFZ70_09820 [Euzebyales bacterium]
MTVERLVELVIRALTVEGEIAEVRRARTVHSDRVGLVVVDRDGDRWRLWVAVDPWAAPA